MNDKKYPQNADRQPKRRKAKDNPYTIFTTGIGTEDTHYFVRFKDVHNQTVTEEITREQYEVFDESELAELSELHKYDNHIEHRNLSEAEIEQRLMIRQTSAEDIVIEQLENTDLQMLLLQLTPTQRRRLLLHYSVGLTYREIAEIEGCHIQAVKLSIKQSKDKIMKFL